MDVLKLVKEIEHEVIEMRRYLHENPEVSMKEEHTIAYCVKQLKKLGISYEIVEKGGIIGVLDGDRPGKTIILRSDLDALPIDEARYNRRNKKTVISKKQGAAHLCGHDAHMAMLLGTATILSQHKNQLTGRVIFAFEQGEEIGGGIYRLLERLVEIGADGVWGIHMKSDLASGKISVDSGPRMAGVYPFHVELTGTGGHGSRPDLVNSPLDCFHAWYQRIQQTRWRDLNPFEPITFSIGSLHAGSEDSANVIPDSLRFHGTARFLQVEQGEKFANLFKQALDDVCTLYQCDYRFLRDTEPMDMLVYNNEHCSDLAKEAIKKVLGKEVLSSHPAWMASEPFAFYQKYFPGVFAFVGIENAEKGTGAEHHNAYFDIDDNVLYIGIAATVQYVLDFLQVEEMNPFMPEKRSVAQLFKDIGF